MNTATTVEREIKLRFESVEEARAAIMSTGATPLLGRRLQEDSLLDTIGRAAPKAALRPARSRRVRKEPADIQRAGPAGHHEDTRRSPKQSSATARSFCECLDELGSRCGSATRAYARSSLTRTSSSRSTRRRSACSWRSRAANRESPPWRRRLAASQDDYLVDSYRAPFVQHLRASGLSATDMVFAGPDGGV